jgi:hypothetical protein
MHKLGITKYMTMHISPCPPGLSSFYFILFALMVALKDKYTPQPIIQACLVTGSFQAEVYSTA